MQKLSAEELLDQYRRGQRKFEQCDLNKVELFSAKLREINLQSSWLNNAYLPYANLSQAQLQRVQLQAAELSDAPLYQTNLSDANLKQANLSRANLRRANLSGADLTAANLNDANLSRANLDRAKLTSTQAKGSNFFQARNVDLTDTKIDDTTTYPDGHRAIVLTQWLVKCGILQWRKATGDRISLRAVNARSGNFSSNIIAGMELKRAIASLEIDGKNRAIAWNAIVRTLARTLSKHGTLNP